MFDRKLKIILTEMALFFALFLLAYNCGNDPADQKARLPDNRHSEIIQKIVEARQNNQPIEPLTKTFSEFSNRDAYQIQLEATEKLRNFLGGLIGYKVAFASRAAQQQLGISEPAFGPFFKEQRIPSGSSLPVSHFREVIMETEVAFTVGKRIDRKLKDVSELKNYIKWVHAAFDFGDDRFITENGNPVVADLIATGAGAHVLVVGPAIDPSTVNVDAAILQLIKNGEVVRESPATEVMGSPWISMLWLANKIIELGGNLEPGDVVLTGTAAPAFRAAGDAAGGTYEGNCGELGKVSLNLF